MRPLDDFIKSQLDSHLNGLERLLNADVISIVSPILSPLEIRVRNALEKLQDKKSKLGIILETGGGVVEVIERIVGTIRHHYSEVVFLIPNRAMSAGTVFVMSGDQILMDYFSCLGPIDPQIEKDGKLFPALSYLRQYERLKSASKAGELTTAEFALLNKLDLGELYQFEQARELSIELIVKWLSSYKFKNWIETDTRNIKVTKEMREERANEIADLLSDDSRWHSHGRGLNMQTLREELNLKIDNFSSIPKLNKTIHEYFALLQDYMVREEIFFFFVHTREEF